MRSVQQQLSAAQTQIQQQQAVLSSSQDLAKQIFSSHRQIVADLDQAPKAAFAEIPLPDHHLIALYLILPDTPIAGTIQVQFNQTVAAPNSMLFTHNLLILFIQQTAEQELLGKPVAISYFPDLTEHDLVHALKVEDGRVFADSEPLPKIGQADLDFKPSKWFLVPPAVSFEK